MKTKMIFLITVLAVMFGGTSAIGLADEHDGTPEANTSFTAQATIVTETAYINFVVCNLTGGGEECGEPVAIEVTPNEEGGELTHGSYVSAFTEGFAGPGKGCLMRYIAQSNWGQPGVDLESYDVLAQAEIHCAFNRGEVEGEDDGTPPPWAGIGKKKWEAEQTGATSSAGGPPSWADKGGSSGSDD